MLEFEDKDRILLENHEIDRTATDTKISQQQIQPVEPIKAIRQRYDRTPLIWMFRLLANPDLNRHCGPPLRNSASLVSRHLYGLIIAHYATFRNAARVTVFLE